MRAIKCVTPAQFGGDKAVHQLVVPPGIGDISWVYSKVKHLPAATGKPVILYASGGKPHRAAEYVSLLPGVHWGGYIGRDPWEVLIQGLPAAWPPHYGLDPLQSGKPTNISANLHLEAGRPLADFLPLLPTSYQYSLDFSEEALMRADELVGQAGGSFPIAVYTSSRHQEQNHWQGWRLWQVDDWLWFLDRLYSIPELEFAGLLFIGAEYDREKTETIAAVMENQGRRVGRVIGEPLEVALAVLGKCAYACCYPSGIGIMAHALAVPGFMLLPFVHHGLERSWLCPVASDRQLFRCFPAAFPEQVFDWLRETGLPAAQGKGIVW